MPEGPEVTIISRYLNLELVSEKITNIEIGKDSRYDSQDPRFKPLIDKTFLEVSSKGKKIIFVFEDTSFMLSFLGMEGRWEILESFNPTLKHISLIFYLKSGKILQFRDQRHFGCVEYHSDQDSLNKALSTVGTPWLPSTMFPDIVTKDVLWKMLSNKRLRKTIMMFIVDQKYTSGVGNYIRADALYLARISPWRELNQISRTESDRLFEAVRIVMEKALKCGGHTLRSYFNPIGTIGGYEPYVYGRTFSRDTEEPVIRETDSQKRSIFWCPSVQV